MREADKNTRSPLRERLDVVENFIRATFFGFTSLLVLLSAGVVEPQPDAGLIVVLILVAVNFHCFGYVHNDVVDLPVDRTAPLRGNDPLVTGKISPRAALVFAWANLLASFAIAYAIGATWQVHGMLVLGYLATIVYNLYGKRFRFPFVTDAVQGVAWISIALVGSLLTGKTDGLSYVIAGFGFGFIFLINGVHGGLRDLVNDRMHGRINTAIFFGAHAVGRTRVRSSRPLQAFAIFVFLLIMAPTGYVLFSNQLGYDDGAWKLVVLAWCVNLAISAWLNWQVVKTEQADRVKPIYTSSFFLLLSPLIVFVPSLGDTLRIAVLACFFVPMLIFEDRITPLRTLFPSRQSA